ncbi:sensor domain-containing diguanylate cyclase [Pseudomonas sp. dw_358]|uniref:sensor domain-containing diguanylate cyclase n=1 Tax=Pseudomonas sp. dw_358 TaxID=2720083 RepID=UPI001BD678F2|nr:sensor domain-containing diguanylate cyclase [Pseudomonas sp. dw_358]
MTDATLDTLDVPSRVYQTLLESTKAIPWHIDWATMTFTYIGPQIEALLGWPQDSWQSVNDWVERMHPEDRDYVVDFCVSQSKAGVDHEADYRALTRDGHYVWIRDVVHVVRQEGEVQALIGFMFDISERKKQEEQLAHLHRELEALSYQDGLTGIANRRRFDNTLAKEWSEAQRSGQPLSLILMDIDCFKQYNDQYGHLRGDECLKRVGQLLSLAAQRPRDLVARFGGEEFVWLLPDTDAEAARELAEKCRVLVRQQRIAHELSPVAPVVTLSLGVGTVMPSPEQSSTSFVEQVDRALYQAKREGRDRVV